jgi:hypothetical protein
MERFIERMEQDLLSLDESSLRSLVDEAMRSMTPLNVAEDIVSPALRRIGEGWQEGSVALSQVYVAGKMADRFLDQLLPQANTRRRGQPRMAISNLEDYHNLGQRIVWSFLRAAGFEVTNYERQEAATLATLVRRDGIEMVRWTRRRAGSKVKEAIDKAAQGGGFILSDNHGELPFQVPWRAIRWTMDAALCHGGYGAGEPYA